MREKLIELLCEAQSKSTDEVVFNRATYAQQLGMEADHLIANGVTVQARGEWVVCGDGEYVPFMCSHCGKTTAYQYKMMYGKYCPNCGAEMDLK